MHIVVIGWAYVVLMMVLAEALGPGGTLLGAFVTLVLYGVLPIAIVVYIGGARGRTRARRQAEREIAQPVGAESAENDPGRSGHAAGQPITTVREEP